VNLKPTNRTCCIAAGLVLLSLSGYPAQAGGKYYRWVDETGTTVNSDRPPPAGVDYETIVTNTNLSVHENKHKKQATLNSQSGQDNKSVSETDNITRMEIIKNPDACAAARKNLETLRTNARIRKPDGEGSYRYLNEEEKAEERARAEATISQNCE
jgi:hypothetical protein